MSPTSCLNHIEEMLSQAPGGTTVEVFEWEGGEKGKSVYRTEARIREMFGKYPNRIMTNAEHLRLEAQDALRDPAGLWNPEERKARHDILIQRAEGIEAQAEAATLPRGETVKGFSTTRKGLGYCPKCESWCYGDCEASRG